eukprot:6175040-Pleurochrysis_carterae.AAC.2
MLSSGSTRHSPEGYSEAGTSSTNNAQVKCSWRVSLLIGWLRTSTILDDISKQLHGQHRRTAKKNRPNTAQEIMKCMSNTCLHPSQG